MQNVNQCIVITVSKDKEPKPCLMRIATQRWLFLPFYLPFLLIKMADKMAPNNIQEIVLVKSIDLLPYPKPTQVRR